MPDIHLSAQRDIYTQALAAKNDWNNYFLEAGDDDIYLYQGTVLGGPGNDRIEKIAILGEPWHTVSVAYWDSPAGVHVDLSTGIAQDGWGSIDTLINVDQVSGSGWNDWFQGNASDNSFWPNGGNDTILGGAGNDYVGINGFQHSDGSGWHDAGFYELDIQVSADGRTALVKPKAGLGTGFNYQLTDIELLYVRPTPTSDWQYYNLTDLITEQTMAEQAIAAGTAYRWNSASALGTPVALTFSFVTSAPASGVGATGFRAMTEPERALVRTILQQAAAVSGLSFTEVTESGSTVGQLRFGVSQQASTKGVSWMPGQAGAGDLAGDVWMDVESMIGIAPGTEGYQALLHEIGHALGLRHPRNYDPGDAWSMQLVSVDDRTALSVMSGTASGDGLYRSEWGPLDVLALRYLYGIRSVGAGDTTYTLGAQTALGQTTLLDDGGTDTLDASLQPQGVQIDLSAGGLTSWGFTGDGRLAVGNLAVVGTSVIENAVGSPYDDVIYGGVGDNRLTGGQGNDYIDGRDGTDTAVFPGKVTDYTISLAYGRVSVLARNGTSGLDTLVNVERFEFSDQTLNLNALAVGGVPNIGWELDAINLLTDVDPAGAVSYQWYADATPIAGAVGASWQVDPGQVGHRIAVQVQYQSTAGGSKTVMSALTAPVTNGVNSPVTGTLGVDGTLTQGQLLTANTAGLVDADGVGTFSYQWFHSGAAIVGATSRTYLLAASDVGQPISVRVSYIDGHLNPESIASALSEVVLPAMTAGNDTVTAHESADIIDGLAGDDLIRGMGGADSLMGNSGNDTLEGGAGNDTLVGGPGNDSIDGGEGDDVAAFAGNLAAYTIQWNAPTQTFTITSVAEGVDRLAGVETFRFADQSVSAASRVDNVAPAIVSFNPADEARTVATTGAHLNITFTEAIARGTGTITLRASDTGVAVEQFNAASSAALSLSGSTLTINPTQVLANGKGYYLDIPSGAVKDLAGNAFAGSSSYNFTTVGLTVNGTAGNDTLLGTRGDDVFHGAAGTDTLVANYLPSQYLYSGGVLSGADGVDALDSVEQVRFGTSLGASYFISDLSTSWLVDPDGSGPLFSPAKTLLQQISDLYVAFFNRAPDPAGLMYWFRNVSSGEWRLDDVSASFTDQAEYVKNYPPGLSNRDFVYAIYQNLFDRTPDEKGWDYWVKDLEDGSPRSVFILTVIRGAYSPTGSDSDKALLKDKHDVSLYYSEQLALHPTVAFDNNIDQVLNRVGADPATVAKGEAVVDYLMSSGVTLAALTADTALWNSFW